MVFISDLRRRKTQRLRDYDYARVGAYYITICTQDRANLFGDTIDNKIVINRAGQMVEERLLNISNDNVSLDKYCIMPDHIHAIIIIHRNGTTQGSFPTLSNIVRRFKTITTKIYIDGVKSGIYPEFNNRIWQKSFNDHIIRDNNGYKEIWNYIDNNQSQFDSEKY